MSVRLEAELRPVSHGGHYVAVPDELAAKAGVKYADRVGLCRLAWVINKKGWKDYEEGHHRSPS